MLDSYTKHTHHRRFVELRPSDQDALLARMEDGQVSAFTSPTSDGFFAMMLEDAYEGMFADPQYGGNRGFAGWKLVGYPGAQRAYTAFELQNGPQHKRVQGLREMPAMNPGRPGGDAIMPLRGSRMPMEGDQ